MGIGILSGCQSSTAGESSTVRLPASWKKTNGNPKLDAVFLQMSADIDDVHHAVAVLAEPCMKDAGFDYVFPEEGDRGPTRVDGRLSVEQAKALGYQSPLGPPPDAGQKKASSAASDPRYYQVLQGKNPYVIKIAALDGRRVEVPLATEGCEGLARRSVISKADYRLMTQSYWEVVGARGGVKNRIDDDGSYAAAEEKWSSCMGDAGYPVSDKEDNQRRISKQFMQSDVRGTAAEKKRAVADATCRERHLYPVYDKIRAELDDKALSDIEGPLTAWIEKRDQVLAKVAKALREGP